MSLLRERRSVSTILVDSEQRRVRDIKVRVTSAGHCFEVFGPGQTAVQHCSAFLADRGTDVGRLTQLYDGTNTIIRHYGYIRAEVPYRHSSREESLHEPRIGGERAHGGMIDRLRRGTCGRDLEALEVEERAGHDTVPLGFTNLHEDVAKRARKVTETISSLQNHDVEPSEMRVEGARS